jgi:hypothetical protein
MRVRVHLETVFLVLLLALFVFPGAAQAYLDPGTGSYIIQIALAAIVGTMFAVRLFWGRIKAFFKKAWSSHEDSETDED